MANYIAKDKYMYWPCPVCTYQHTHNDDGTSGPIMEARRHSTPSDPDPESIHLTAICRRCGYSVEVDKVSKGVVNG